MPKLMFADLNSRLQGIFENEDKLEGYRSLCFDLANGNDIYNKEGKIVSKAEANKKQLMFTRKILGLPEDLSYVPTKREINRALKHFGQEWFEVTEELIDIAVETGFHETEFFNSYVEERNIARGDSVEFWTDQKIILSAVKVAGDHHDFNSRIGIVKTVYKLTH